MGERMKTILITTAYLDNKEYEDKTIKFVEHYSKHFDEIEIIDNGSTQEHNIEGATISTFHPHYTHESHLSYKYLWRALYQFQYYLSVGYDRIVYCDNDAFMLSDKMFDWAKNVEGWASPFCIKHNFPETGIQVITKNCKAYQDFVGGLSEKDFIDMFNGLTMETTLPLTDVNKDLKGDRWSEYDEYIIPNDSDFSTQTSLEKKI